MNRSEWLDDDGTKTYGTPVDNEELQKIYDNIEDEIESSNKPNVRVYSIIDNLIAGVPFDFGGDPNAWIDRATFSTGAGYDPDSIIAPGSRVWKVDPALLSGSLYLEALLRTNNVLKTARLALFNMTDAPNVAMVTITSASLTGELVRSGVITWPAGGSEKTFAVKLMTDPDATALANGWGYRVYRGD